MYVIFDKKTKKYVSGRIKFGIIKTCVLVFYEVNAKKFTSKKEAKQYASELLVNFTIKELTNDNNVNT